VNRHAWVAALLSLALMAGAGSAAAQPPRQHVGRPVPDVLRELQRRGLPIVFSTELVRDSMRVMTEPAGESDQERAEALLAPHGLELQAGPGRTLLVVRARRTPPARPPAASAAPAAAVRGIVVDARTALPLAGVRVSLAGESAVTVTDLDGRFELAPVAVGEHTVAASLVGYTLARPKVLVPPAGVADVAIALADGTGAYGEQITVTGDRFRGADTTTPSAVALTSTDLLELRGVLTDDPLRAVQALPSVMTGADHRSEFSVRGSDFRHVGLSIDGVAIGWPIHTVRDDVGAGSVALVNGDVLASITLASGAYPQERLGATGAWLDMTVREGSRAAAQAHGAVGMASASLVVEGPLSSGRGSWLVSGRQSYLQWILARMDADGTRFGFSDVLGKVVYDVTPRQRVHATVLAGRSALDQEQPGGGSPNSVRRGTAHTTLLSAGWQWTVGSRSSVSQTFAIGGDGFANDSPTGGVLAEGSRTALSYRGTFSHSLRPQTVVRGGVHVERRSADEAATWFIGFAGEDAWVARDEVVRGSAVHTASFGRLTHTVGECLVIDGGILVAHAPAEASPWVTVTVPLGPLTMRGGGGIYRQAPDLEHTVGSFGDPAAASERARHAEAALEQAWGGGLRWQLSVYQREERDILELEDNDYLMRDGTLVPPSLTPRWRNALGGSSRGVEALLQRRSAAGLSGWLSYSWSRTRYVDELAGERFDGGFDQRHTLTAYALYRVSPVTSLSARFRYGSNFPIPGYVTEGDPAYVIGTTRHGARLPAYARLDVRANRAFNFESRRLTLFAEVVNLLGRGNHAADTPLVFRSGRVAGATQDLFPFLPTAGIQIDF
jgi:hypothetical protein